MKPQPIKYTPVHQTPAGPWHVVGAEADSWGWALLLREASARGALAHQAAAGWGHPGLHAESSQEPEGPTGRGCCTCPRMTRALQAQGRLAGGQQELDRRRLRTLGAEWPRQGGQPVASPLPWAEGTAGSHSRPLQAVETRVGGLPSSLGNRFLLPEKMAEITEHLGEGAPGALGGCVLSASSCTMIPSMGRKPQHTMTSPPPV